MDKKPTNRRRRSGRNSIRGKAADNRLAGRLPRNAAPIEVTISHIGGRGDGVGRCQYTHNYVESDYDIFVPASLPGEQVLVQPLSLSRQGIKARIIELKMASPDRRPARCSAFPACGGCSFQHWDNSRISRWKQDLISHFLDRAGLGKVIIRPPHISPSHSRRRASLHLKRLADEAIVGFQERSGQHIVRPADCAILHPALLALQQSIETFANTHLPAGFIADIHANILFGDNHSAGKLCVYIETAGDMTPPLTSSIPYLVEWASTAGIARLTINDTHGPVTIYAPETPAQLFGSVAVSPPPGAFLQATRDGEAALQAAAGEIVAGASRIADLFAGCGTLSLPLLDGLAGLVAVEADRPSLAALKAGADAAGLGGRVTIIERNLFDAPLLPDEVSHCDAVIIDPPRSGAAAQCQQLAHSSIDHIAMVSCNPASFARDAAILTVGGFTLSWVQPVDQFSFSNHLELVGAFHR